MTDCEHRWRYMNSRDVFYCTKCRQLADPDTGETIQTHQQQRRGNTK